MLNKSKPYGETNPGAASSGRGVASEPVSLENNVAIAMEVEDLKQKVARLIEQEDQRNREKGNVSPVMPWVELMEDQTERWRLRLPNMLLGDQIDEITTAIEVQEELQAFKAADRRRIEKFGR